MAILKISEKFNSKVDIDITTFRFYGSSNDGSDRDKGDCISFCLTNVEETQATVDRIKAESSLKEPKVFANFEHPSYRVDKRPKITVYMPNGSAFRNSSQFWFENEEGDVPNF